MIKYAYKNQDKIKYGILNSDDENELKNCIPKGLYFWNLNKIDKIDVENYTGIGESELMLKVEKDVENI